MLFSTLFERRKGAFSGKNSFHCGLLPPEKGVKRTAMFQLPVGLRLEVKNVKGSLDVSAKKECKRGRMVSTIGIYGDLYDASARCAWYFARQTSRRKNR